MNANGYGNGSNPSHSRLTNAQAIGPPAKERKTEVKEAAAEDKGAAAMEEDDLMLACKSHFSE